MGGRGNVETIDMILHKAKRWGLRFLGTCLKKWRAKLARAQRGEEAAKVAKRVKAQQGGVS